MVKNCRISLDMGLMLYVNSKLLMVKCLFITHSLIVLEQLILNYHNVLIMLYLNHILVVQILLVHIIYLIQHVIIVNCKHLHIFYHHHKINLVGLVVVVIYFVLVLIIIIFVILMVLYFHKKEFYWLIIVGLVIIHKHVKKSNRLMDIIVKIKIMVFYSMKV